MGLLYAEEHLTCTHYQKVNPLIKVFSISKGEIRDKIFPNMTELLFVTEGSIKININNFKDKIVSKEEIALLPPSSNCTIEALEDSYCVIVCFQVQVHLCESFSMTQLFSYIDNNEEPEFRILNFNRQIATYIDLLNQCISDGINCIHLYEMKKHEIFLLLRAYYPKDILAKFFHPILNKEDMHFKIFVLEKCLCAKNVQELASMANYSTSGFIKKFTRCFDESPYRWISQYKADKILHDINDEKKSFKEIYTEYNFSSMPHFIEFCKKQYGQTPGKMRKKKEKSNENA